MPAVEKLAGTSPAETVPAMRSVLMILPRNPTSKNYPAFLNHTLELSMQAPFHQPRIPAALLEMGIDINVSGEEAVDPPGFCHCLFIFRWAGAASGWVGFEGGLA